MEGSLSSRWPGTRSSRRRRKRMAPCRRGGENGECFCSTSPTHLSTQHNWLFLYAGTLNCRRKTPLSSSEKNLLFLENSPPFSCFYTTITVRFLTQKRPAAPSVGDSENPQIKTIKSQSGLRHACKSLRAPGYQIVSIINCSELIKRDRALS